MRNWPLPTWAEEEDRIVKWGYNRNMKQVNSFPD